MRYETDRGEWPAVVVYINQALEQATIPAEVIHYVEPGIRKVYDAVYGASSNGILAIVIDDDTEQFPKEKEIVIRIIFDPPEGELIHTVGTYNLHLVDDFYIPKNRIAFYFDQEGS